MQCRVLDQRAHLRTALQSAARMNYPSMGAWNRQNVATAPRVPGGAIENPPTIGTGCSSACLSFTLHVLAAVTLVRDLT